MVIGDTGDRLQKDQTFTFDAITGFFNSKNTEGLHLKMNSNWSNLKLIQSFKTPKILLRY